MKQLILILALLLPLSLFSVNSVFAQEKYPEGACKQIYAAIGIFLKLADHEWKKTKDEEKISASHAESKPMEMQFDGDDENSRYETPPPRIKTSKMRKKLNEEEPEVCSKGKEPSVMTERIAKTYNPRKFNLSIF